MGSGSGSDLGFGLRFLGSLLVGLWELWGFEESWEVFSAALLACKGSSLPGIVGFGLVGSVGLLLGS